jgi:CheY-like chemotaxis protein
MREENIKFDLASIKKYTVLDVYDCVSVNFFSRLIRHMGLNCIESVYSENLLEIATQYLPDIILLEQFHPNDLEVCHQLKTNEKTKNIPVIVITACEEEITESIAMEAGADSYLVAPVKVEKFRETIQSFLNE